MEGDEVGSGLKCCSERKGSACRQIHPIPQFVQQVLNLIKEWICQVEITNCIVDQAFVESFENQILSPGFKVQVHVQVQVPVQVRVQVSRRTSEQAVSQKGRGERKWRRINV